MNQHLTIEDVQRIADGESQPADHVRDCVQCANAILDALQMKRAVRDVMRTERAPASLLRRVRRQPPATSWFAAAAAIAAIVIGSAMLFRQQSPSALVELADMHVTLLASANPVDVLSTDRHTVKPWFEGRVPFAVPVPELASTPFRLIGGRVVYWRGNQAAYMLIGKNAHRISLFVFREDFGPKRLGTAPAAVSTLTWQRGGLTFIAIGDVADADLVELRDAFAEY
ncbi:MAG TPA: hypothetical protein VEK56_02410 [Vicinamibacterales bacterium]|nr:hypothetical protein [Vicinamibacterales bacterium]